MRNISRALVCILLTMCVFFPEPLVAQTGEPSDASGGDSVSEQPPPLPEEVEIHRNLAFALVSESEYAAAWPHVEFLIDAGVDAWWIHLAAAQICLYWRRDLDCVETYAQLALEQRPETARAYTLLGQRAQELDQIDEAIDYYRQSLAIRRSETEVVIRLADLLDRSGETDEAIATLATALQANRRDARLMIRLAALIEPSDPDYAEILYTEAVSYHEEPALAYGHLLRFYRRQGRTTDAERIREVIDELVAERRMRPIR